MQCGGNIGDDVTIPLPDWVLALRETVMHPYTASNGLHAVGLGGIPVYRTRQAIIQDIGTGDRLFF
jgi:hypothetical protein